MIQNLGQAKERILNLRVISGATIQERLKRLWRRKEKDYLKNSEKQAKVKAYEKKIDQMVYELYGLTKEEIKIVENFNKN